MGWAGVELFIQVCETALEFCEDEESHRDLIQSLVEVFHNEDFDTFEEAFDTIPYLEEICREMFPEWDWDEDE